MGYPMLPRLVRVIETSVGRGYTKLRIVVDLRKEHVEKYGFEKDDEVELVERPDGLLIKRKGK